MSSLVKCTSIVGLLTLSTVAGALADTLPTPFDTAPFDTDAVGNSAANLQGFFRKNGGPQQFRYFIGTEGGPASLIMDFVTPFTDGPGDDFAILTASESWGPLADTALFQFFLAGNLQASFTAKLSPDQLFQFDLPIDGVVADRVVLTNLTPDPPGINNLAGMTFDNAGVAYAAVAEPASLAPLSIATFAMLGYSCLHHKKRRYLKNHVRFGGGLTKLADG